MGSIKLLRAKLALDTRNQSSIENFMDRLKPTDGCQLQIDNYIKEYPGADHRPVGPCSTFNCHGLTFASRRTWISYPLEILKILKEDDYHEVAFQEVRAGDIAVYFVGGDAEHSGIVVEITAVGPRILSKWANLHEVIHLVGECPYDGSNVTYFRISE